jgi:hypothetical protein
MIVSTHDKRTIRVTVEAIYTSTITLFSGIDNVVATVRPIESAGRGASVVIHKVAVVALFTCRFIREIVSTLYQRTIRVTGGRFHTVITLFIEIDLPVTTERHLERAGRGAAVTIHRVAVITLFTCRYIREIVSTLYNRTITVTSGGIYRSRITLFIEINNKVTTFFYVTLRRTVVAILKVAVVALFTDLDKPVTTYSRLFSARR